MVDNIIVSEWLFDEQQPKLIELGEVLSIIEGVDAIGINLEQNVGPGIAHRTRGLNIPTGFDFEFDA